MVLFQAHVKTCRLFATQTGSVLGWAAINPVSGRWVYGGVGEVSVYIAQIAQERHWFIAFSWLNSPKWICEILDPTGWYIFWKHRKPSSPWEGGHSDCRKKGKDWKDEWGLEGCCIIWASKPGHRIIASKNLSFVSQRCTKNLFINRRHTISPRIYVFTSLLV